MNHTYRNKTMEWWRGSEGRVLVSTTYAGHGLNQSDVDFILHLTWRWHVNIMAQEWGRGGRNGETCTVVVVAHPQLLSKVPE